MRIATRIPEVETSFFQAAAVFFPHLSISLRSFLVEALLIRFAPPVITAPVATSGGSVLLCYCRLFGEVRIPRCGIWRVKRAFYTDDTLIIPGIYPFERQGDYVCQVRSGVVGRLLLPCVTHRCFSLYHITP